MHDALTAHCRAYLGIQTMTKLGDATGDLVEVNRLSLAASFVDVHGHEDDGSDTSMCSMTSRSGVGSNFRARFYFYEAMHPWFSSDGST